MSRFSRRDRAGEALLAAVVGGETRPVAARRVGRLGRPAGEAGRGQGAAERDDLAELVGAHLLELLERRDAAPLEDRREPGADAADLGEVVALRRAPPLPRVRLPLRAPPGATSGSAS